MKVIRLRLLNIIKINTTIIDANTMKNKNIIDNLYGTPLTS